MQHIVDDIEHPPRGSEGAELQQGVERAQSLAAFGGKIALCEGLQFGFQGFELGVPQTELADIGTRDLPQQFPNTDRKFPLVLDRGTQERHIAPRRRDETALVARPNPIAVQRNTGKLRRKLARQRC